MATLFLRTILVPLLASALAIADPAFAQAPAQCTLGSEACPAVARMVKGAVSVLVRVKSVPSASDYFVKFDARAGQSLTLDPVRMGSLKWGAGVPITLPGGTDFDVVEPDSAFKLPGSGTYVIRLPVNRMADRADGSFTVRLTIR